MSKWTTIENNASFNILKDGKRVEAKTINHVLDNVEGNLQYLYEHLGDLEQDKGSVVLYNAPTAGGNEFTDTMLPGTPVYWVKRTDALGGGYWASASIAMRVPRSDESEDFYWIYDDPALAQGIVVRRNKANESVDVCLSGKVVFDVVEDPENDGSFIIIPSGEDGVPDLSEGNPLENLFNHHNIGLGGSVTISSAFDDDDDNEETETVAPAPAQFRSGTFYLCELQGKLVPTSPHPRTMAVMFMDKVSDRYQLNTLVCPDGFGGERFHNHREESLASHIGLNEEEFDLNTEVGSVDNIIPQEWFPRQEANTYYLNTGMGEVEVTSEVYPYTELIPDPAPSTPVTGFSDDAIYAETLYTRIGDPIEIPGWLSAHDPYFTDQVGIIEGFSIPTNAIWGFTPKLLDTFSPPDPSLRNWIPPVAFDHIILTLNGIPIPSSHYLVDESGIWWIAAGAEHAPIYELFVVPAEEHTRQIKMWFINPLGESKEETITSIESDSMVVTKEVGGKVIAKVRDEYMATVLSPVMAFNPIDDLTRASGSEVEQAETNKLMTPVTTKYAIEYFTAITELNAQRGCQVYNGMWDNLLTTGFYKVSDINGGPDYEDSATMLALVGALDNGVFQFAFDSDSSYLRVARHGLSGPEWGPWQVITSGKYKPVYLPGEEQTTTLNTRLHSGRELVSADDNVDIVTLPLIEGEELDRMNGSDFTFINQMNPASVNSVLVIKLQKPIETTGEEFLVSVGQECVEANHCMGLLNYELGVDVLPDWLNAIHLTDVPQVFATGGSMAPQHYGTSTVRVTLINGSWVVSGGTGAWFLLSEDEYIAASGVDEVNLSNGTMFATLIDDDTGLGLTPLKLSERDFSPGVTETKVEYWITSRSW